MTVPSPLTIERIRIYRYQMPLRRAYGTARGRTTASTNFVVHLVGADGRKWYEGFGESQPRHSLTGDGEKDRSSAWQFLKHAVTKLHHQTLSYMTATEAVDAVRAIMADMRNLARQEATELHGTKPFRGTLLGIEVALLDLVARSLELSVSQLLGERRADVEISISTISTATSPNDIARRVQRQIRFPITRLKGRGDINQNLQVLRTAASANWDTGREKPLWIDINEAMNFDTAAAFIVAAAKEMDANTIPSRLIVEGPLPLADGLRHADLQKLADQETAKLPAHLGAEIQIMPDESLWDAEDLHSLNARGGCRAINIKAPKAGGLLASLDLAEAAIATNPNIRIGIGGMLGTSELTAWALHNLGRAMPRLDYMTTVPPRNVETPIAEPPSTYVAKQSNVIRPQKTFGLGTSLILARLRPYVTDEYELPNPSSRSFTGANSIALAELDEILNGEWNSPPPAERPVRGGTFVIEQVKPGQVVFTMEKENWPSHLRRTARQHRRTVDEVAAIACARGAAAVVTSSPISTTDIPVLSVPNTRLAARELGREARKRYQEPLVAVTGTVGKSTTKDLLAHVISTTGAVMWNPGNWNTLDGVPLTLMRLLEPSNVAVVEAAHGGFVRVPGDSTAHMIRPNIAIITAIGEGHAQLGKTTEETARLKAKLFTGLSTDGLAVLNIDTPNSDILLSVARSNAASVVTYGSGEDADIRLTNYDSLLGEVTAEWRDRHFKYRLGISGEHNALNSLAVLATLDSLNFDLEQTLPHFSTFTAPRGKGSQSVVALDDGQATIIDQSYNANPTSMRATLRDFAQQFSSARRLLLLGDMLELGEDAPSLHGNIIDAVLESKPTKVYLVGPLMTELWVQLPPEIRGAHLMSARQAVSVIGDELTSGDALFIKASAGTGLGTVAARLGSVSE